MTEVLSRGKTQNSKWVYWNEYGELVALSGKRKSRYVYHRTKSSISYYHYAWQLKDCNLLIKETIGQFTGLTDKNGKKIFEGDIVRFSHEAYDEEFIGAVVFDQDEVGFILRNGDAWDSIGYIGEFYEIIGNIHDNPELLED